MKLTKGNKYDPETLTCIGWTQGDGSGYDGYNVADYFRDGIYLGADAHGIEPEFHQPSYAAQCAADARLAEQPMKTFNRHMASGFNPSPYPWLQSWNGPSCLITDKDNRSIATVHRPGGDNGDMIMAMNANLMSNGPILWEQNKALICALKGIIASVRASDNEVLTNAVQAKIAKAMELLATIQ